MFIYLHGLFYFIKFVITSACKMNTSYQYYTNMDKKKKNNINNHQNNIIILGNIVFLLRASLIISSYGFWLSVNCIIIVTATQYYRNVNERRNLVNKIIKQKFRFYGIPTYAEIFFAIHLCDTCDLFYKCTNVYLRRRSVDDHFNSI